jgi:glycosyltransferase involved in cell wall biosynthesis
LEIGVPENAFVVGHIAQPIKEKRFDLLVEIIDRLHRAGVPIRVLQLGRGPDSPKEEQYFAEYQNALHAAGVKCLVHRTDFVRDISSYLAIMDAVVQTSDIEGFPNGVIEALSMERPVVATDAGGTSDLVRDGVTGWLVEPGDIDTLVSRLIWVFNNREKALQIGKAGRALVEHDFSVDTMVRKTTALYQSLLRKKYE